MKNTTPTPHVQNGIIDVGGGERLAWTTHGPREGSVRGDLVLVHGYGDHQGRYQDLAGRLASLHRIRVCTYDCRGHGLSTGQRGHIDSFGTYLTDLEAVVASVQRTPIKAGAPVEDNEGACGSGALPLPPLFLLGHSQGGCIALQFSIRHRDVTGVVASSPMLGLCLRINPAKAIAGRILGRLAPRFSMPSGLRGEDLTRDQEMIRRWQEDPLVVRTATAGWYREARRAMVETMEGAAYLTPSLLMMVCGQDRVVDPSRCMEFYRGAIRAESRELAWYDDFHHEPFQEIQRESAIADVSGWLERRLERLSNQPDSEGS